MSLIKHTIPINVYLIIERNYFLRGRSRFNGRKFYMMYELYVINMFYN